MFVKLFIYFYFVITILIPVVGIFYFLFSSFSLDILKDSIFINSVLNSIFVSFFTALFSTVIGVLAGFFLSRTNILFKKIFLAILTLPVLFVPYQMALSLSSLKLPDTLTNLLFSKAGVIFVLTGCFYPIVMWFSIIAFKSIPREEEEAALLIYSPKEVFYKLILKRVFPFIVTGSLLTFFFSFSEFGVANYLGVNTLPYQVLIQFSAFYDINAAFTMAIPMSVVGVIIFIVEYLVFSKNLKFLQQMPQKNPVIFGTNRLKIIGFIFLILISFVFFIVPSLNLIYNSLNFESFIFSIKNSYENLIYSLFYALVSAILISIWALLSVYFLRKIEKTVFSIMTLLIFFLPPVVIAISIIYVWSKIPSIVYGTVIALILGLLSRFSFIGFKIMDTIFEKLDKSPEESAILIGLKKGAILLKIVFPQLKKWFFLSVLLVFVFCMNEFGVSSILYPAGKEPITVKLYTLSVNNPISVSSAIAIINSAVTLIVVFFIFRYGVRD